MQRSALYCAALLSVFVVSTTTSVQQPAYCSSGTTPRPPPPPGMTVLQAQVFLSSPSRLRALSGECWKNDLATFNCSLNQLMAPYDASSPVSPGAIALGRVFRLLAVPNAEELAGDCFFGQLTGQGYLAGKALGQALQSDYRGQHNLLPNNVSMSSSTGAAYFRAFNSPAPVVAGQAVLAGMFPPTVGGELVEVVDWLSMDQTFDNLTPNVNLCPALKPLVTKAQDSLTFQEHHNSTIVPLLKQLAPIVGQSPESIDLARLSECVVDHACEDAPMPEKLTQAIQDAINAEQAWYWHFLYSFENYRALAAGPLFQMISDNLDAKASGKNGSHAFMLFCAPTHGAVVQILGGLGLLDSATLVPLGSNVVFELLQGADPPKPPSPSPAGSSTAAGESSDDVTPSSLSVRMLYNHKPTPIPGCPQDPDGLCALETVRTVFSSMIPSAADCSVPSATLTSQAYATFDSLATGSWL